MKIILVGASGHMGRVVAERAAQLGDEIAAGIDPVIPEASRFPLLPDFEHAPKCDVVIDFSRPESLNSILAYCRRTGTGAVLASTGYTDQQKADIAQSSDSVPVFLSANFSIGISLLCELAQRAAKVLAGRCDIEIVERHHNRKVDAPSGTALMLADAVSAVLPGSSEYVYGRQGRDAARQPGEIGIHAVRGGTLVGEHSVMFLAEDEELELTHRAYSREVFAEGALAAARFLRTRENGLYGMADLLQYLALVD